MPQDISKIFRKARKSLAWKLEINLHSLPTLIYIYKIYTVVILLQDISMSSVLN